MEITEIRHGKKQQAEREQIQQQIAQLKEKKSKLKTTIQEIKNQILKVDFEVRQVQNELFKSENQYDAALKKEREVCQKITVLNGFDEQCRLMNAIFGEYKKRLLEISEKIKKSREV